MKLYTEEQVNKAMLDYIQGIPRIKIFNSLTHIELPSDEEMSVCALKTISELNPKLTEKEEAFYIAGFVECAKWLRNKIQGGNQ